MNYCEHGVVTSLCSYCGVNWQQQKQREETMNERHQKRMEELYNYEYERRYRYPSLGEGEEIARLRRQVDLLESRIGELNEMIGKLIRVFCPDQR